VALESSSLREGASWSAGVDGQVCVGTMIDWSESASFVLGVWFCVWVSVIVFCV
jgi:hypothetical protein